MPTDPHFDPFTGQAATRARVDLQNRLAIVPFLRHKGHDAAAPVITAGTGKADAAEDNVLDAMNTQLLAERLFEEGCNPDIYAIGSRGVLSDGWYLAHKDGQWQVCYTERGRDSEPIFVSGSESQACTFFFQHITAMRHDHCVGFFKSRDNAVALEHDLSVLGIQSWSDEIPYAGIHDPRYRVFVSGKAIFLARKALGVVPRRDIGV